MKRTSLLLLIAYTSILSIRLHGEMLNSALGQLCLARYMLVVIRECPSVELNVMIFIELSGLYYPVTLLVFTVSLHGIRGSCDTRHLVYGLPGFDPMH